MYNLGMEADLRAMIERLTTDLESWLDRPSEASSKIARLRGELAGLGDALKGEGRKAAMKALDDAESEAKRQRQKEAAEAIAELCRPLGVRLEARDGPKRPGRKAGSKSASKPGQSKPRTADAGS